MSNEVDYTGFGGSSRPQEGRNDIINASIKSKSNFNPFAPLYIIKKLLITSVIPTKTGYKYIILILLYFESLNL